MQNEHHPRHHGGVWPYINVLLIALTVVAGELIIGFITNSLALISDASHTFGDSLAIMLALWFEAGRHRHSDAVNRRRELVTRLLIGGLILFAAAHIGHEGYERLHQVMAAPPAPPVIAVALLCIWANRRMLVRLGDCNCHIDAHLRAHIRSDWLVSAAVAGGGVATWITGEATLDAILSLSISIWIGILGIQVILDKHSH